MLISINVSLMYRCNISWLRDSAIRLSQRLPVVVLFGRAELLCRTCHVQPFFCVQKAIEMSFALVSHVRRFEIAGPRSAIILR